MADLLQDWRNDENQNMPDNLDEYKITDAVLKIFCQQKASWTFLETISLLSGYNPMWRDEIKASAKCPDNVLLKAMGRSQVRDIGNDAILQSAKKTQLLTGLLKSAIDIKELDPEINDEQEQIFKPIDIVLWADNKGIELPNGIGDLVKKHTKGYVDLEAQCAEYLLRIKKLESRYTILEAENVKLKDELSVPNPKRKCSLQKGFIGMLSAKYTRDKVLNNFGENAIAYNLNGKEKLTLKQIEDDLALQGIHIDDGSIKALIDSSIHHLHTKSTKQ